MRFRPTTMRARLTLWYTLFLGVPLAAFAILSFFILTRTLQSQTDAFLLDALAVFAREVAAERRDVPAIDEAIRKTVQEVRFRDLDIFVLDESRTVLALSAPLNLDEQARQVRALDWSAILRTLRRASAAQPQFTTLAGQRSGYRLLTQPLDIGPRRFIIASAYPLGEVEATLRRIRRIFLIAIPLLIAIASTGGYFLAQ